MHRTSGPDFVIIQCGLDGLAGDLIATCNWCLDGVRFLRWCITQRLRDCQGKKLLLGGGMFPFPALLRFKSKT